MTNTLANPARALVSILITGLFALSLLFAVMPAPAHAASLTEPQIQAILSLLVSFDVDEATISNVDAILHNKSTPTANTQTGNTENAPTTAAAVTTPPTATTATTPTTANTPTTAATPSTKTTSPTANTAGPAPVCVLVSNKSTATPGEQITLTWKSSGATYSSSPNGNTGANGAVVVTPTATTVYQKTVYGPGGSAQCQATVTVSSTIRTVNVNPIQVMAQPDINLASVAAAVAQFPFSIAITSLTDIFVQLGIGQ